MRFWLALLLISACACGSKKSPPAPPTRTVQKARALAEQAANALGNTLIERLTAALQEGSPEHALDVCSRAAQEISLQVRKEQGVEIRRTSLKLRNPVNRPDPWEEAWLRAAPGRKDLPAAGEAEVVTGRDGKKELRYARPIYTAKLCLQCHGPVENLPVAVREMLKARYPDDQATGYRAGDLRGMISVRVPLE